MLTVWLATACKSPQGRSEAVVEAAKPNVLFIAVDDLRPELGAYGATHIQSPHMDALAEEGMLFERAYCNVPVCGSSRASLLSGIRPGWHHFGGPYDTYLQKDYPGIPSLPMHFKNNGYQTVSLGKIYHHSDDDSLAWHASWRPTSYNGSGWRDYVTEENIALTKKAKGARGMPWERVDVPDTAYYDGRIASKAIEEMQRLNTKGKPFFLAVGFLKPHLPFNAPEKYWQLYDSMQIALPANYQRPATTPEQAYHKFGELRHYSSVPEKGPVSEKMAKQLIQGYYACVSYTDAQIGRLMEALKANGLAENTIVILWGDHGWNLGDHKLWCKHCNFASSLHTPVLLKAPGYPGGQRTGTIVEYVDIYPTLADLAGLPLPAHLQGESMQPLLEGKNREKDYAISKYYNALTLVKGELFYTEFINKKDEIKARMLFDHSTDPLELENLAEKPENSAKVAELSQFLRQHRGKGFFEKRNKENQDKSLSHSTKK